MGIDKITPVILAGGQGKRLWPLSTASRPKQFIPMINGKTLFERTVERLSNRDIFNPPVIVGSTHHQKILQRLSPVDASILLENERLNTAPAIAMAVNKIKNDSTLLITPADHFIPDIKGFEQTALNAAAQASRGFIATIGIKPNAPHTGYGYIQKNAQGDVEHFHEKPNKKTAGRYLKNDNFYWNSGIYVSTRNTLIKEYSYFAPEILQAVTDPEALKALSPISFDHAIAEKTFNAVMVEAQFSWSDIGNWNAYISLKAGRIS